MMDKIGVREKNCKKKKKNQTFSKFLLNLVVVLILPSGRLLIKQLVGN